MASLAQSVTCMVNVIDDQCTSSLALKTFRDGAQANSAGSPFQLFMTREANAFLHTRDAAANFMSFREWPLVVAFSGLKKVVEHAFYLRVDRYCWDHFQHSGRLWVALCQPSKSSQSFLSRNGRACSLPAADCFCLLLSCLLAGDVQTNPGPPQALCIFSKKRLQCKKQTGYTKVRTPASFDFDAFCLTEIWLVETLETLLTRWRC